MKGYISCLLLSQDFIGYFCGIYSKSKDKVIYYFELKTRMKMSGLGQKSLSGGDQGQGRQGEEQWLQIGRLSLIVLTCKLEKLSG